MPYHQFQQNSTFNLKIAHRSVSRQIVVSMGKQTKKKKHHKKRLNRTRTSNEPAIKTQLFTFLEISLALLEDLKKKKTRLQYKRFSA